VPATSGFRGYQPRAQIFKNAFTGAVIATPVLDLSAVRGPQGYADRSGTGANGVPIGAPCNVRGVFDEGVRFGGVNDGLNCGSNVPLDIAGDISAMCWVHSRSGLTQGLIVKTDGATGWGLYLLPSGLVSAYLYSGALSISGTSNVLFRWAHAALSVKSNVCRIFTDGLQEARSACVMSDAPASSLYCGFTSWPVSGLIELPQVYNGALSPEQVYRNYLQASQVPIYYDTFESYAVTPVAKAVGSMCGPFRVTANSLLITADAAGKKWVQGGVVGFCYGVGDWTEYNAYGTWEFDFVKGEDATDTPYFGMVCNTKTGYGTAGLNGYMFGNGVTEYLQLYRITNGGVALAIIITVAATVVGTAYRCRITRRVGGQFTLYLKGGAYPDWTLLEAVGGSTNPTTDNTYTSGQFFNTVARGSDKLSGFLRTRTCERPASFPWEFSATGTWAGLVSASTIWMRCLTSGNVYLPKDLDWQTCDLKLYKGADANVTDVLLVATELGGATAASQNGYCLRLSADERVQLCRIDNGVVTVLVQTAAAYVAITTEYSFHVTRVGTTGAFVVSILGGAYATWTEAVTVTDNTYTMGNYFNVDIDADDRITAPVFAGSLKASV